MTTIESVCNQALSLIGHKRHIGNILEGSAPARVALDFWGNTRDRLLEAEAPEWAIGDTVLVLLKSAPNIRGSTAYYDPAAWSNSYPEPPWLYEYEYPTDCVDALQIKSQPFIVPVWKPRSNAFRLNYAGQPRSLLCNVPNAILCYVRRVLDPNYWTDDFILKMKLELARQFEPVLAPEMHQQRKQREQQADASNSSG